VARRFALLGFMRQGLRFGRIRQRRVGLVDWDEGGEDSLG
jgi:hypothetical protein